MTDPNRFAGGVVDLGEVKARAEARAQRQSNAGPGGGGAESGAAFEHEKHLFRSHAAG